MHYSNRYNSAINVLSAGGIIAYPTEAVWGLGCDPDNPQALTRLLHLKHRHWQKGLILIAAEWSQLEGYLLPLDKAMQNKVFATWPGPVTWLLPCKKEISPLLRGHHATLAVRISDHPVCRELCRKWGKAVVSTSANPEGRIPAASLLRTRSYFGTMVDCYLPGATGGRAKPSQIRDSATGALVRS